MRITKVVIPEKDAGSGLKTIKMQRLGQVVLLAGQNGAGKSRVLRAIHSHAQSLKSLPEIEENKHQVYQLNKTIQGYETAIAQIHESLQVESKPDQIRNLEKDLTLYERVIDQSRGQMTLLQSELSIGKGVVTSDINSTPKIVEYVPKELKMTDPFKLSKEDINDYRPIGKVATET